MKKGLPTQVGRPFPTCSVCVRVFLLSLWHQLLLLLKKKTLHTKPPQKQQIWWLLLLLGGVCVCVGCCCCLGADRSCLIWSCSRLRPFYFEAPRQKRTYFSRSTWRKLAHNSSDVIVFISPSPRNISERWRRHWWFYRFYWRLKFWRSTWTSPAPWRTGDPADPISDSVSTSTRIEDSTGKPNFSFGTKLWRHPGGENISKW